MGTERYGAEGFCIEENSAFLWFQGYGGVTPAFCSSALERMADEEPEVVRDKVNNYPLGERLLSRLYFSGFSDDVMGELFPDEAPEEELVVEEAKVEQLEEVIEPVELPAPAKLPVVFRTTVIPPVMPVDRPRQERAARSRKKSMHTTPTPLQIIRAATLGTTETQDQEDNWKQWALCAQTDPEAFFPEKGGSTRLAKKVCALCDVSTQCLESALKNDERFGVWGGLSERERRKLRRLVV